MPTNSFSAAIRSTDLLRKVRVCAYAPLLSKRVHPLMVECLSFHQVFEGKIETGVSLAVVIAGLFQLRGSNFCAAESLCVRLNLLIVADHLSALEFS